MVFVRGPLVALLLGGCASISSVQTADTLGTGRLQVAVEPGVWGGTSSQGTRLLPHVDAAVRYGVTEKVDVGVRAGSSFLELGAKFLVTQPGDPRLAVSLAPAVGGMIGPLSDGTGGPSRLGGFLNLALPVLVGFKTAGGSEFVLGPRAHGLFTFGSTPSMALGVGMSVGFMWRLGERVGLMPEVSVVAPVASNHEKVGLVGLDPFGAFVQLKVGVLFGAFRPRPTKARLPDPEWEPSPGPPPQL